MTKSELVSRGLSSHTTAFNEDYIISNGSEEFWIDVRLYIFSIESDLSPLRQHHVVIVLDQNLHLAA